MKRGAIRLRGMKKYITTATACLFMLFAPSAHADSDLAKALATLQAGTSGCNLLSVKLDDENFLIVVMDPKFGAKFYKVYKFSGSWKVSRM